jgi:hypothetical protein
MVTDLHAGVYDALVLDAPVLEYTVGTNEECDLFTGRPSSQSCGIRRMLFGTGWLCSCVAV